MHLQKCFGMRAETSDVASLLLSCSDLDNLVDNFICAEV